MDFSAPHVNFVVACYVISAVLLIVMSVMIAHSARAGDRQLDALEAARDKQKGAVND